MLQVTSKLTITIFQPLTIKLLMKDKKTFDKFPNPIKIKTVLLHFNP